MSHPTFKLSPHERNTLNPAVFHKDIQANLGRHPEFSVGGQDQDVVSPLRSRMTGSMPFRSPTKRSIDKRVESLKVLQKESPLNYNFTKHSDYKGFQQSQYVFGSAPINRNKDNMVVLNEVLGETRRSPRYEERDFHTEADFQREADQIVEDEMRIISGGKEKLSPVGKVTSSSMLSFKNNYNGGFGISKFKSDSPSGLFQTNSNTNINSQFNFNSKSSESLSPMSKHTRAINKSSTLQKLPPLDSQQQQYQGSEDQDDDPLVSQTPIPPVVDDYKNPYTKPLKRTGPRFFLLRHGQSEANVAKLISSNPEYSTRIHGLTERGRKQARGAGERLRRILLGQVQLGMLNTGKAFSKKSPKYPASKKPMLLILASDFLRTRHTAEEVVRVIRRNDPGIEILHYSDRRKDLLGGHLQPQHDQYTKECIENMIEEQIQQAEQRRIYLVQEAEAFQKAAKNKQPAQENDNHNAPKSIFDSELSIGNVLSKMGTIAGGPTPDAKTMPILSVTDANGKKVTDSQQILQGSKNLNSNIKRQKKSPGGNAPGNETTDSKNLGVNSKNIVTSSNSLVVDPSQSRSQYDDDGRVSDSEGPLDSGTESVAVNSRSLNIPVPKRAVRQTDAVIENAHMALAEMNELERKLMIKHKLIEEVKQDEELITMSMNSLQVSRQMLRKNQNQLGIKSQSMGLGKIDDGRDSDSNEDVGRDSVPLSDPLSDQGKGDGVTTQTLINQYKDESNIYQGTKSVQLIRTLNQNRLSITGSQFFAQQSIENGDLEKYDDVTFHQATKMGFDDFMSVLRNNTRKKEDEERRIQMQEALRKAQAEQEELLRQLELERQKEESRIQQQERAKERQLRKREMKEAKQLGGTIEPNSSLGKSSTKSLFQDSVANAALGGSLQPVSARNLTVGIGGGGGGHGIGGSMSQSQSQIQSQVQSRQLSPRSKQVSPCGSAMVTPRGGPLHGSSKQHSQLQSLNASRRGSLESTSFDIFGNLIHSGPGSSIGDKNYMNLNNTSGGPLNQNLNPTAASIQNIDINTASDLTCAHPNYGIVFDIRLRERFFGELDEQSSAPDQVTGDGGYESIWKADEEVGEQEERDWVVDRQVESRGVSKCQSQSLDSTKMPMVVGSFEKMKSMRSEKMMMKQNSMKNTNESTRHLVTKMNTLNSLKEQNIDISEDHSDNNVTESIESLPKLIREDSILGPIFDYDNVQNQSVANSNDNVNDNSVPNFDKFSYITNAREHRVLDPQSGFMIDREDVDVHYQPGDDEELELYLERMELQEKIEQRKEMLEDLEQQLKGVKDYGLDEKISMIQSKIIDDDGHMRDVNSEMLMQEIDQIGQDWQDLRPSISKFKTESPNHRNVDLKQLSQIKENQNNSSSRSPKSNRTKLKSDSTNRNNDNQNLNLNQSPTNRTKHKSQSPKISHSPKHSPKFLSQENQAKKIAYGLQRQKDMLQDRLKLVHSRIKQRIEGSLTKSYKNKKSSDSDQDEFQKSFYDLDPGYRRILEQLDSLEDYQDGSPGSKRSPGVKLNMKFKKYLTPDKSIEDHVTRYIMAKEIKKQEEKIQNRYLDVEKQKNKQENLGDLSDIDLNEIEEENHTDDDVSNDKSGILKFRLKDSRDPDSENDNDVIINPEIDTNPSKRKKTVTTVTAVQRKSVSPNRNSVSPNSGPGSNRKTVTRKTLRQTITKNNSPGSGPINLLNQNDPTLIPRSRKTAYGLLKHKLDSSSQSLENIRQLAKFKYKSISKNKTQQTQSQPVGVNQSQMSLNQSSLSESELQLQTELKDTFPGDSINNCLDDKRNLKSPPYYGETHYHQIPNYAVHPIPGCETVKSVAERSWSLIQEVKDGYAELFGGQDIDDHDIEEEEELSLGKSIVEFEPGLNGKESTIKSTTVTSQHWKPLGGKNSNPDTDHQMIKFRKGIAGSLSPASRRRQNLKQHNDITKQSTLSTEDHLNVLIVAHGDVLQILQTKFMGEASWKHRRVVKHMEPGELREVEVL